MQKFDLSKWEICNPDHREDLLPQPYRLINEVLTETILYNLNLSMYEIEEKKKDKNYEGGVKEYLSQNTIDVQNIACFSSNTKHHNHLLAGDKSGNVYLLDLAKKIVFSKKELVASRRVISICETMINDGDLSITTIAVVLNGHNKIYLLRYKHSEPKLTLTHTIEVAVDECDPNKLPYSCQFEDYGRLLFVCTYDGSIHLYRVPEVKIDLEQINKNQAIPLEEEQFKKKLRYPLNYALLETEIGKIGEKLAQIKFQGKRRPLTKEQLIAKMTKKVEAPPVEVDTKKDPKKKEEKKVELQEPELKEEIQFNNVHKKRQLLIQNGHDNTPSLDLPKFQPFFYVVHSKVQLQKKKEFEKGKFIQICEKIIYGWTNTKQFKIAPLFGKKANYISNYQHIQHFLQKIPQKFTKEKNDYLSQKLQIKASKTLKNIYEITSTGLSIPDEHYFATGMSNGVTSVWSTNTLNIIMNTDKQRGAVTCLKFFEGWKLISGSSKGEVHIDNILDLNNQVKRTNLFQSKIDHPITNINISELGVAFVLDSSANLRVYDLWRSEKIAKIIPCNSFALIENRGKRWVPSSTILPSICLYTNNDFTAILSSSWPNFSMRELEQSESKRNEINGLINNPWKCRGTNVHVIRNFEFLLTLFDGLENIYKKGYERKKVENLFSNLEFTQLYDRNFDIPDFGVSNNGFKKGEKGTEVAFGVGSKTHISTKSRDKTMKESSSASQGSRIKSKLTNEVLHPEKFLLQRRKIEKKELITDEKLKSTIRESYKKQGALENTIQNDLSKGLL